MSPTKTQPPPAEQVEVVTPADVRQAEREAAEAAALVDALEKRVVDGDDTVTADQIENARSLGRFAKLRAQATANKAERHRAAARLRACHELRAEIEGYKPGSGQQLAKLLSDAEAAITAFVTAAQERNETISVWRERMFDLKVSHANPMVPPASQGGIGVADNGLVIAGRRRMEPLDINHWVVTMLARVNVPGRVRFDFSGFVYADGKGAYERLAQVDDAPEVADDLRFFRSPAGGGVVVLDEAALERTNTAGENAYRQQIGRGELVEISRREAWGQ